MNLIYIGERFYADSGSRMSSLYTENGVRQDWGTVQVFLRGGRTVTIRPATPGEITQYEMKLQKLRGD